MKRIKKPILPLGFKANGIACGIKKLGKPDLALLFSQAAGQAFGLFTTNRITSGSVKFTQENLKKSSSFQAILVNSGNANCFTKSAVDDASGIAQELAGALHIKKEKVLIASTGIIGKPLPVNPIKKAIPNLVGGLSQNRLFKAAEAITTTDTFTKLSTVRLNIGKRPVTICGFAKGAGMIAPRLATMLCFILTDARITQDALREAFKKAVDNSFNCITIDGCMSTNDTALILSNGIANNPLISIESNGFNKFCAALTSLCLGLAKMIIKDAEGASKFIQISVRQAKTYLEAKNIALSIANSNLFKAAMFGENPNIGRVVAAVGSSGTDVKEKDLKIKLSPLNKKEINIDVFIKRGNANAVVYTSDLTPQYVKINAGYN